MFDQDSTPLLMKKYFVYKLMGSDLFINHSLTLVNLCYKILGVSLTNFAVNNSVSSLFTSGESLQSLMQDKADLQRKNIGGVGMSVVEGMPEMNHEYVAKIYDEILEFVDVTTRDQQESHFALKFTALISTDIMTRMSRAQQTFMNDILKFNKQEPIDTSDLRCSLLERGISFSEEELLALQQSLQFEHNTSDKISRLEIYANAHLLRLDGHPENIRNLMKRIAIGCGVGLTENDL